MNNGSFSTGGQAQNPTFGTVVVTAALQLNAGAVFDLYNTADKTNYERLRAYFAGGSTARLVSGYGGSATARSLQIGVAGTAGSDNPTLYHQYRTTALPFLGLVTPSSGGAGTFVESLTGTGIASSGTQTFWSLSPTIKQTGTAGYTALDVNPTETTTGSGTKLLQRWAVGSTSQALLTSSGTFAANINNAVTYLGIASSLVTSADVQLARDAADTLALRRSTNAQTFRGYETYTDASNYSRWYQTFSGGFAYYGTQAAGTGTRRPLIVQHSTTTLAALPTAASVGPGSRAVISDAAAPVFGAAVVGGGAVVSPVYSDGANWIVG